MKQKPSTNEEASKRKKNINNMCEHYDYNFLITVIILVVIGIVMISSSSMEYSKQHFSGNPYHFMQRQSIWSALGLFTMYLFMELDYKLLHKWAWPIYIFVNVCLAAVLLVGQVVKGAKRWLGLGPLSFQPSELMKLGLVLLIAHLIATKKINLQKIGGWIRFGILTAIPIALIILQPNLSMVILLAFGAMVLIFVSSPEIKFLLGLGGLSIVGVLAFILKPSDDNFRKGRFDVWLNPFLDPQGKGFQTVQSLFALGSGGLFGLGLGNSRQKWGYIPEAHNDIIFAIISEELGLIGSIAVLFVFLVLIWKGIKIAMNAPDEFSCLLTIGLISILALQVMINVSVVTNTIPVTGVTLPFISYGGSSIIFTLASMGMILNVSKQSKK